MTKICKGCEEDKPIIAFSYNSRLGNYKSLCKECTDTKKVELANTTTIRINTVKHSPKVTRSQLMNKWKMLQIPICVYCGKSINGRDMAVDHITPISAGGLDTESNFVIACRACNSSKNNKPLLIWLAAKRKSCNITSI